MITIKQTIAMGCIALAGMSGKLIAGDHGAVNHSAVNHSAVNHSAVNVSAADKAQLDEVLEARSAEHKARHGSRHPSETLAFFGIKPGMTVVEVLPGGGWYTQVIAPYLGDEGTIYGVNYADNMWPLFGFFSEERIKERIASTTKFPSMVEGFAGKGIAAKGFTFGQVPAEVKGKADAVLLIRAFHNINRFAEQGMREQALADIYDVLKPGGIVGVVQHRAPETADDKWADGSAGYLKKSTVVKIFEGAGFKLLASSEVNANPLDKPTQADIVWRLPPGLNGAKKKSAEEVAALKAIGESDRMTLRFEKVEK